ncbi:MAG: large conductance mechanosensitive channel protein MscL [Clostridia bacterium]|nr:large conductance mechanosensitive channel protein MscL [Clostridia bacterium]
MRKFFSEFKKFITRGNVLDLAVGVIIGSAFSAIVTALTNKILMPIINALLALGGNGLEDSYTFLKRVYTDGQLDLTKSIYIDWGAFITAIINFILIALVLFIIIRSIMRAQGFINKQAKRWPNKAERKVLREQGVNMRNREAILTATKELREKNKPAPAKPKPTQEELLTQILEELKKQNLKNETIENIIEESNKESEK